MSEAPRDLAPDPMAPPEATPVEVPIEMLSAELLDGVIESFVLREGTDYGAVEASHDSKLRRVRAQLEKGAVKLVFDPNSDTVTLLTKLEWERLSKKL